MKKALYILLLTALCCSCTKSRQYFPRDLKLNAVQTDIVRFDSVLTAMTGDTVSISHIRGLYAYNADFTRFFSENIIGIPASDTAALADALTAFLNDTVYGFLATNMREKEMFSDITGLQNQLNAAFSRLSYLYPTLPAPGILFFISGFNASLLFWRELDSMYLPDGTSDDIAIGTDMYLGKDWEYYNRVVYNYQKQNMRKECIPIDITTAFLFKHFPFESKKSRLIDNMIYRGKLMYLTSVLFPNTPEYEVMGYSKEQYQWCRKNEKYIWQMMMDKHDLFKTETLVLTSYLNDGPFTSEISQEAPARLGTWIGWQIVRSYMENNPDVSLQDLVADHNAQHILELSNYRP